MGIFTKLKNGKLKEHKTIGEKKEDYKKKIKDETLTKKQRYYAFKKLKELNDLTEKKTAVSKNFVGKDGDLTGNKANPGKARYGVCTRVREDGTLNINVLMPKKESEIKKKNQVEISAQKKFGWREHAVMVHPKTKVNINDICEDKGFLNSKSRILTCEEFSKLRKLSRGKKKRKH